jgi:hypothetical protein
MSPTRREFIKQFGVMLASLVVSNCTPGSRGRPAYTPIITCYEAVEPTPTPPTADQLTRQADILTTSGSLDPEATRQALAAIGRERLRATWQQLNDLAAETTADFEGSEQKRDALVADHRAALDDLVAHGELAEAVAGPVQVAFEAAAYHVWRSNAPITCYAPVVIDYKPVSSDRLVNQAQLLAERDDLDPQTLAQAQAAIAKEIAFLNMSQEEVDALYDQILSGQQSGQPIPDFEDVDLDVPPQDLEAAQFLVGLLLGNAP